MTFALLVTLPSVGFAQGDGARFYCKSLSGFNAVPAIGISAGGNANPADPAHTVLPGSEFEATLATVGYARMFSLGGRAASAVLLVPMGRLSGDVTLGGRTFSQSARGFGDPLLQLGINLVGPKPIKNIPDLLRYEPGFSLDVIGSLAVPIGEYHHNSPLNIGQNRWYGRVGAPMVLQLGPWIPGKRTTLEFLPAVWLFGNNDDFVGQTLSTEPIFQMEAHLTRDLTDKFWGSLDVVSITGGKGEIAGVEGESLQNVNVGLTLGYMLNDSLQLTAGYVSSVGDSGPGDLTMDQFRVTLVYGWHPLVEGMKRLGGNGH